MQEDGQQIEKQDEIDYLADFSAPMTNSQPFVATKPCGEIGSELLDITETGSAVMPTT